MHRRILVFALLLGSVMLPLSGYASNMRFLEFSPSAFFTEKDWDLLRGAARNLLDNHKDGESISWKNDDNGHNGKLTLINTFADFGTTCRRLKVFSDAIQVSATRVVNMCKNKEGQWRILN